MLHCDLSLVWLIAISTVHAFILSLSRALLSAQNQYFVDVSFTLTSLNWQFLHCAIVVMCTCTYLCVATTVSLITKLFVYYGWECVNPYLSVPHSWQTFLSSSVSHMYKRTCTAKDFPLECLPSIASFWHYTFLSSSRPAEWLDLDQILVHTPPTTLLTCTCINIAGYQYSRLSIYMYM